MKPPSDKNTESSSNTLKLSSSQNKLTHKKDSTPKFRKIGEIETLSKHIDLIFKTTPILKHYINYDKQTNLKENAQAVDKDRNKILKKAIEQRDLQMSEDAKTYLMACFRIAELEKYNSALNQYNEEMESLVREITYNPFPLQRIPLLSIAPKITANHSLNIRLFNEYFSKIHCHKLKLKNMMNITDEIITYSSEIRQMREKSS